MMNGATQTAVIAVPVFNGERYLREALVSAMQQTFPTEIVVFDNASTDGTRGIVIDLLGSGAVRTATRNTGAAANFNRAVSETTSDYFMWLAHDDRLHPTYVERCIAELKRLPDAPACLTAIRFIDPDGNELRIDRYSALGSPVLATRLRAFVQSTRWTESYCMFRRSALVRSPGFTGEYGTDVLFVFWFVLRGPLAVVPDALLDYREYPSKTNEEMEQSIDPSMRSRNWRKLRMWCRLWSMTAAEDLSIRTRFVARRELLLALTGRAWRTHIHEDVRLWLKSHSGAGGTARARG
jgi:glycosyltransferase involved in cell wall biosynthesis